MLQLYDPHSLRYEVPIALFEQAVSDVEDEVDYNVTITENPFAITVTRRSTGEPL